MWGGAHKPPQSICLFEGKDRNGFLSTNQVFFFYFNHNVLISYTKTTLIASFWEQKLKLLNLVNLAWWNVFFFLVFYYHPYTTNSCN